MNTFTKTIENGKAYTSTVHRGTEYTIRHGEWGWELTTRRLSLGRWNLGGFKRFDTFTALQESCKAFAGLNLLDVM